MQTRIAVRLAAFALLLGLCGLPAASPAPAAEGKVTWSLLKLPGCDDLPRRMAKYYKPVEVDCKPAVRAYRLPVDLGTVTNSDFDAKMHDLGSRASRDAIKRQLARTGFVAVAAGKSSDVAGFYKNVKLRELPLFITSDSLLHLYHIQFDETLKDVEDREFFKDATLISKAIQAEATKIHDAADGEIKTAARLLVGYAAVPAVLLSKVDLGAEAGAALKEAQSWGARPKYRQRQQFAKEHAEVLSAVAAEQKKKVHNLLYRTGELKSSLEKYVQDHPVETRADLVPSICAEQVQGELDLIAAHRGFQASPLFVYKEDYSQYVPRGHYTRSKKLRQYFKALMWYGRMTFLIRGKAPGIQGVVKMPEARKQTIAASLLAGMMQAKLPDGRTLAQAWDRLYAVTAYYVGLADDLTPYEYRAALRKAVGHNLSYYTLTEPARFFDLRRRLAMMRKPEIYSGLGDLEGPPGAIADEETLADALAMTQGLRLMGQRYIPDSFVMGRLVYPTVGPFTGTGEPFTLVKSQGGPVRGFPRGLDVMAVLGSARARHWLKQLGDDAYRKYDETLARLTDPFAKTDRAGWNRNMYWSWLHTLQALLKEYPLGYPTFMRTQGWRDKQLSAALASWSQLRHDTLLYAKQSYTMRPTGMPRRPKKMVEGYVEPVPEFYARLLALTRMTLAGLEDFGVLHTASRRRLAALEKIVSRLLAISRQELANRKLTAEDYAFIRSFGDQLQSAVAGVSADGLQTTIVADVHTDGTTRQVLEEGTGWLHPMVVIYPMPDGGLVAGVGPVLSHYEFKHPMSDRLTDEAWRSLLGGPQRPALPAWARAFTAVPEARRGGAGRTPRKLDVKRD